MKLKIKLIELVSGNRPIEYKKDFMKIKFESDDNLLLGKILNIPVCIIIVKSVFQKKKKKQLLSPSFFT